MRTTRTATLLSGALVSAALTLLLAACGGPAGSSPTSPSSPVPPTGASLNITTASLPQGTVGVAYATTLQVSGGSAPFTWSLAGGALPSGMSIDARSGTISGTPAVVESATAVIQVQDSSAPPAVGSRTLPLTVVAAPPPLPPPVPPTVRVCTEPLATIFSPAPGSTLPGSTVTFEWCDAGRDYFLDVESVFGSHNLFFATVRTTSVTLTNIPTNGGPVYVTLWTQTGSGKTTFQAAPVVTYTAGR